MKVTDADLARAESLGRIAGRGGCAVNACPFEANGSPAERMLAARWVRAYLGHGGTLTVDYEDGEGPCRPRDMERGGRRLRVTVLRRTEKPGGSSLPPG